MLTKKNTIAHIEDGYDSEGEIGPYYNAVENEGPLKIKDPTACILGGEGGENPKKKKADVFVNIPDNILTQILVKNLQHKLKKRSLSGKEKRPIS